MRKSYKSKKKKGIDLKKLNDPVGRERFEKKLQKTRREYKTKAARSIHRVLKIS